MKNNKWRKGSLKGDWRQVNIYGEPEEALKTRLKAMCSVVNLTTRYSIKYPLCVCHTPKEARWVSNRLNLAKDLETLVYKYAAGAADGKDILIYVADNFDLEKMRY